MVNYCSETCYLGHLPIDIVKCRKDDATSNHPKHLVIVIPGNPGIIEYYYKFIGHLCDLLEGSVEVWAISHSCHSSKDAKNKDGWMLSPLETEIEHKLRFLLNEVPSDCSITLIGHSIGCYMIQKVLEILSVPVIANSQTKGEKYVDILRRIKKCYFLFPTIEHIKASPNGIKAWPFLQYFHKGTIGLVMLFNCLPFSIKKWMVSYILTSECKDESIYDGTYRLLQPKMTSNVMHLAYDEFINVNELRPKIIEDLKHKIVIYYGTKDGWCPLSYKDNLLENVPDADAIVDDLDLEHCFVVKQSRIMASVLAKKINLILEQ